MPSAVPAFAELHCRSNFTFLTGASHPYELIEQAADLGLSALAVTDVVGLYGVVQAMQAAEETGLTLLVGSELPLADGPRVVALALDRRGYGDLTELITLGRRRAAKGAWHLTVDDLRRYSERLLCLLLPPDPRDLDIETGAPEPRTTASELSSRLLHEWREWLGDRLYVGLRRWLGPADRSATLVRQAIADEAGIPTVATNSPEMHVPRRKPLHDLLACIRHGVTLDTAGYRLLPNAEAYLKSAERMAVLFHDLPEAVTRTVEVAQRCRFSMRELRFVYPDEHVPSGLTPSEYLRELTEAGAANRYPQGVPNNVRQLLEHELALIADLGYEDYFLTVHDIMRHAESLGILCQGRGSAANSAVCYCLGITEVNLATHNLLFERFISRERNEPPDIDVDFEHERREDVLQYVYDKYGRDHAAMVCEVIRYRSRMALREAGKALGLSLDQVDRLAKGSRGHWKLAATRAADLRAVGLDLRDPRVALTLEAARELQGFPRHLSIHTGGFVISCDPLHRLVPIENATKEGRTVIQWDKDDAEALGLLKVDCLSLGMLTAIRKSFELVAGWTGRRLAIADVPPDDPATYELIRRADVIGVFQIESRAQIAMTKRLQPKEFYDLVIQIAIVRPGPIQGGMVHPYLNRRSGKESPDYPLPELEAILQRTLGVPLFQEQCMQIAVVAAGFTPGEADQLRRAMGAWRKTGKIDMFHKKLIHGMRERGISEEYAERVFQQIAGFAEYGFPESHSASFALLAYVSCWLKTHHRAAFIASLVNSQPMGFYSVSALLQDAERGGVLVLPLDVTHSEVDCTLEPDHRHGRAGEPAIRLGLRVLRGLSAEAAERIVAARWQRPFASIEDLALRARLRSNQMRRLAESGALASLQPERRLATWDATWAADPAHEPLFAHLPGPGREPGQPPPPLRPYSQAETIHADYRHLGLSLTGHPMTLVRNHPRLAGAITTAHVEAAAHGCRLTVAGMVQSRQRPGTGKGVVFVTLEDEAGTANVIVWPSIVERYRAAVFHAKFLRIDGRIQRDGTLVHLLAERLHPFDDLLTKLVTRSRDFH